MQLINQVFVFFVLATLSVNLTLQKDPDEGRPYEFGFTIDGQQHRHEKKDQNGIIQGEFGFITADGIYHVTVYATDENGNFKILSMKNVRISAPLDGSPLTGPISPDADKYLKQAGITTRKPQPSANPLAVPQSPATTQRPSGVYGFTTQPTVKPACAGCGYVTTPKPIPGQPFQFQNPFFQKPSEGTGNQDQGVPNGQGVGQQPITSGVNLVQQSPQQQQEQGFQNQQQHVQSQQAGLQFDSQVATGPQAPGVVQGYQEPVKEILPPGISDQSQIPQKQAFQNGENVPGLLDNGFGPGPGLSSPQAPPNPNPLVLPTDPVSQLPPVTVSKDVIHVGGSKPQDIPIRDKYPGMVDGLPDGIGEKDITGILYKFKYTVGFHGHYEKGLKNGAKIGGYFVNGRDGISRVVTYIADENGYRPKFKLINLGLDSPDTPKEETEKTFGLKSFEFVWYPVG